MYKVIKYIAYALGAIGLILLIRLLFTDIEAIENSGELQASFITPFLYLGYIVLIFAIILVLIFVIRGLFRGNIKTTLISIGGFLLIVAIAYLFTSGEAITLDDGSVISASASHWISAGLVIFYILIVAAIAAVFLGGIRKLTTK